MKIFFEDLLPKIRRFSNKLDDITLLSTQEWVSVDETGKSKTVYFFKPNNELILSTDGKAEKAHWEFLGKDALLIEKQDGSQLFRHAFFDKDVLALKVDNKNEYAFFVSESKFTGDVNSIEKTVAYLQKVYLVEGVKAINENFVAENVTAKEEDKNEEIWGVAALIVMLITILIAFILASTY